MIRITACLLLGFLLLPSYLKLEHSISDHQEVHCKDGISLHFHEAEWDCELQKFKFSVFVYSVPNAIVTLSEFIKGQLFLPAYLYTPNSLNQYFSLRAPPIFHN
ncbi:MAG: hypothetical protein HKN61_04805 [Flavobacteriaceae bacterium]|nr:hypothetical protein [Flavobacteriaceae bacterium]